MDLISFILFLFGSVGITIILTKGDILEPLREGVSRLSEKLGYLVSCPMCSGFWIGLVSGYFSGYNAVFSAGIVSLASWFIYSVVESIYAIGLYFDNRIDNGE